MLFASIAIIGPAFARLAFWPVFHYGLVAAPIFAVAGMLFLSAIVAMHDIASLRKLHAATVAGVASVVLSLVIGVAIGVSGLGFAALQLLGLVPNMELINPPFQ